MSRLKPLVARDEIMCTWNILSLIKYVPKLNYYNFGENVSLVGINGDVQFGPTKQRILKIREGNGFLTRFLIF